MVACDGRTVALLGLSFKNNTDDLRESPNVELAERLIGKGFHVRIYDPVVNPAKLIGSNRRAIEAKLPHLSQLLARRSPARPWTAPTSRSSPPATRPSATPCSGPTPRTCST